MVDERRDQRVQLDWHSVRANRITVRPCMGSTPLIGRVSDQGPGGAGITELGPFRLTRVSHAVRDMVAWEPLTWTLWTVWTLTSC